MPAALGLHTKQALTVIDGIRSMMPLITVTDVEMRAPVVTVDAENQSLMLVNNNFQHWPARTDLNMVRFNALA